MSLLIVTGLSGSGKSHIVDYFEDLGFFCVDNIPPELIIKFAQLLDSNSEEPKRIVVTCDIRSGNMFSKFEDALINLELKGFPYDIIFLEASEEILVNRYKETRRKHPLAGNGILEAIRKERKLLKKIRKKAKLIINTSNLTSKQLFSYVNSIYSDTRNSGIIVNLISFGFKHGVPLDVDLLFDVRFLPNPFYLKNLRTLTGHDEKVSEYVLNFKDTQDFVKILKEMINFLIPRYEKEGKSQVSIGIGCTGGQHRSVVISEVLFDFLKENNCRTAIIHRDELRIQG